MEMLISIGIFAVVVTVALLGLLSVIDASQQQRAKNDAVDSLNYVVDDMVRRIRTGYNFDCGGGGDCPNGGSTFSFTSSEVDEDPNTNPRMTYSISGDSITFSVDGSTQRLTGPPVEITDLTFYVVGTEEGLNTTQARVMISISGAVDEGDEDPQTFSIQTTIAQRLLWPPDGTDN